MHPKPPLTLHFAMMSEVTGLAYPVKFPRKPSASSPTILVAAVFSWMCEWLMNVCQSHNDNDQPRIYTHKHQWGACTGVP